MTNPATYPPGAYVTVRGFSDCWAAVVAHQGKILSIAYVHERAEAFSMAECKAQSDGLLCLVTRGAA